MLGSRKSCHLLVVDVGRGQPVLITKALFDVISIEGVDEKAGWLYYIASPENATQRYLYRTELSGSGKLSGSARESTRLTFLFSRAEFSLGLSYLFDHQLAAGN